MRSPTRQRFVPASQSTLASHASTVPAWWAFLVTLGMTYGRTLTAFWRTGSLPPEWDYSMTLSATRLSSSLLPSTFFPSRAARLSSEQIDSNPRFVCAERVVSFGTGSSLFATVYGLRQHPILVASISWMFALIASGFCLRACTTISRTFPARFRDRAAFGAPTATAIQRVSAPRSRARQQGRGSPRRFTLLLFPLPGPGSGGCASGEEKGQKAGPQLIARHHR
ncbi:hypothetical protein R3P38DRAFT_518770 [Favolaschia claudopus]|uniref:Uncharacterized protein n=1 Tax=Favolaschia claudopus TaxID=2862362 RepID=A0AAV9ZC64_9AGAR